MNLKEMREKLNALATEMTTLHQKESRSADEETRLDAVIAEFNELGPKVQAELARDAAVSSAQAILKGVGSAARTVVPGAGAETRDRRTLGQRFAESDELKEFIDRGSRGKSAPVHAGSFYRKHAADLEIKSSMGPEDVRALIQTGGLPADFIQPQYVPGFFRGDDLQGSIRDALINGTTESDAIVFFRELLFTNNAAAVGQATATT